MKKIAACSAKPQSSEESVAESTETSTTATSQIADIPFSTNNLWAYITEEEWNQLQIQEVALTTENWSEYFEDFAEWDGDYLVAQGTHLKSKYVGYGDGCTMAFDGFE